MDINDLIKAVRAGVIAAVMEGARYPKITAIRIYRNISGGGLAESKDWVEAHPECYTSEAQEIEDAQARYKAKLLTDAAPDMLRALEGIALAIYANPKLADVMIYSNGTSGERLYPFDAVRPTIAKATGA